MPSVFPQDMTSVGIPNDSDIARYFFAVVRPPQIKASQRPRLQHRRSRRSRYAGKSCTQLPDGMISTPDFSVSFA